MIRRLVRNLIVGTPVEALARNVFSRLDVRCRLSTGELRDNAQMFQIMQRALAPGSNCVDIGANAGDMLAEMTRLAPDGTHYAFEPIPALAQDLTTRFPPTGRASVHVRNMALSDASGTAQFHINLDTSGMSTLRADLPAQRQAPLQSIFVTVETLDRVLPLEYRAALVKIDVEGAEYPVVRGGLEFFKRSRPLTLFEFGVAAKNFGTTPEMMFDLFCGTLQMRISRMGDWLAEGGGRGPLTQRQFVSEWRRGMLWNFLAHP